MKHIIFFSILILTVSKTFAQKHEVKEGKTGNYSYQFVLNDPYHAHKYILKNGMTVILSVNKKEPRIQTYIAVKAGSKTDPKNNTGLAHYLEHLLFKGTEKFGTINYAAEKPYLDMIENLYASYNQTNDPTKRKLIYHKIDSISGLAAKYAIANEYDKMMQKIGAIGTNAFTSFEQTVYINDIPSNNLEKWLEIEGERFTKPVFRIFHTELEAVFEEKNISLDNYDSKAYEAMMSELFKKHPYGTQTTIGTVEHLKNPSLKSIREYFDRYYRPNNMALIMSGDMDESKTIQMVDKYFSELVNQPIPPFSFEPEENNALVNNTINITGPSAEFITLGYRFPGVGTKDAAVLKLVSQMLSNGKGGLFDLNLTKAQKVSSIAAYSDILKDYSYIMIKAKPKSGDALEMLYPIINEQIQKLVTGDFSEDLIKAVVANMKVELMKRQESREASADMILDAFTTDFDWAKYLEEFDVIQSLGKKDVMEFASKFLNKKPVIIYKRKGEDKNIEKVEKPEITPVDVEGNRDARSPFAKAIDNKTSENISPKYINYKKEISINEVKKGLTIYHVLNNDNKLYQLNMVWNMGKEHIKNLPYAIQYLRFIGTDKYSNDDFNKEMYKLATEFSISAGNKNVTISLSGLKENMSQALVLVEDLLENAKVDNTKYREFQLLTFKNREDDLLNKGLILRAGLKNLAQYGPLNPFSYNLNRDEATRQMPEDLLKLVKSLKTYKHKIYYYGPDNVKKFSKDFVKAYTTPKELNDYPTPMAFEALPGSPNIYFVDYDMVQAEILWVKNESIYNPANTTIATLFQEYYGGGMGSIVFQTIRESKALAYSCNMRFGTPEYKNKPYVVTGYIGTQADKLFESIDAMNELLTKMPISEALLSSCKSTIKSQIETERYNGIDIIYSYEMNQKLGLEKDIREDIYNQVNNLSVDDVQKFFNEYIKSGKYSLCLVGSKKNINMEELKKYGVIKEIQLNSLFGY
ncbi:MAG: insulinase family protein [Bacteroidetes bacterium]|nr:insulinase family protein [Bacteroidota bacterium]